jgi:hypothetical protein
MECATCEDQQAVDDLPCPACTTDPRSDEDMDDEWWEQNVPVEDRGDEYARYGGEMDW